MRYLVTGAAPHAANPDFNRGYTYDTIGNRWQAVEGTVTTGYLANLLNQYREIGRPGPQSWYPQYDDDGNQLSGALGQAEGKTFEWDGENRLKAVNDAGGAVLVSYTYDHGSRRIRRSTADATALFVYNGWNPVAEYTTGPNGVTLTSTHTWGPDVSGALQGAGGVGGLLVSETPSVAVFYPAYDGNGNVTVLVGADGTATGVYEYDPYGKVLAIVGAAANGNAFRFSTKPEDTESGWLYYGYRWYNSDTGRWTSRDPIEEKGGENLYESLRNNPLKHADPDGRTPQYWPPKQGPTGTNQIFAVCSRALKPEGVIESMVFGIVNSFGGEHTYLQYGSCDKCEGWGFAGGKKGTLPSGEIHFSPTGCTPCKKFSGTLLNGGGKGKKGTEASDQEIIDCIKNTPASKDYDSNPRGGMYVCKDWAYEAAKKCGLDCSR